MNRKFYFSCIFLLVFSVVFRGFSALETGSGSGSGYALPPLIEFKSWQIGRSDEGTDTGNKEHLSFITSTQTLCSFTASVGYKGNLPRATSPIDSSTVGWSVIDASHEMTLDTTSVQKNWSGSHPSQLSTGTSFNVVGALSVPEVVGTRTVTENGKKKQVPCYLTSTSCTASDANRANRTPVHRGGTNMKFKLKFTAQTKAGQTVSTVLALEADEKDQIRQEYVDYSRPIPSRNDSKWTGENTYDFGHYSTMMDVGLADKQAEWVTEINNRKGTNVPAFAVGDFHLTSGYRHPHHNFDHAGSTALLSAHMYGYALDVRGREDAQGNDLDINGDGQNTDEDRTVMSNAAEATGSRKPIVYSSSLHVHVDWAPSSWGSGSISSAPTFSLPPAGTELVDCDKRRENNCNIQVSSSSEHYVTCGDSDCGESYWSCDSDDHDEHRLRTCTWERLPLGEFCGKSWRLCQYPVEQIKGTNLSTRSPKCVTDPNNNRHCAERNSNTAPSGGETTPGSNAPLEMMYACGVHSGDASAASDDHSTTISGYSGTFYECQPHQTFGCGHTDLNSNASLHALQASCSSTNANGDGCTVTSFYACGSHTHVYPAVVIVCGSRSWTGCMAAVSSSREHYVPSCSNCGNSYWSCNPVHGTVKHVTPKVCTRPNCGQTYTECSKGNGTCTGGRYIWHN